MILRGILTDMTTQGSLKVFPLGFWRLLLKMVCIPLKCDAGFTSQHSVEYSPVLDDRQPKALHGAFLDPDVRRFGFLAVHEIRTAADATKA